MSIPAPNFDKMRKNYFLFTYANFKTSQSVSDNPKENIVIHVMVMISVRYRPKETITQHLNLENKIIDLWIRRQGDK